MEQVGFIICEIAFVFAAIIFVHQEKRRKNFGILMWSSSIIIGILILVMSVFFHQDLPVIDVGFQLIMVLLVLIYTKINWEVSVSIAIYSTIWARLFWWILLEVEKIAVAIWEYFVGELPLGLLYTVAAIYWIVGLSIVAKTVAKWIPDDKKFVGPRQLLSAIMIAFIFEMLAFLPDLRMVTGGFDRWMVLFLIQLICMITLYLQNELFRKSALKQELELMNMLLLKEQEQYRLSKENISIINQKCHDLKHQIRAIRKSDDTDKSRYLKEVEDSIRIYEAIVKTGNEVLDTILTEKSLYCKEKGIIVSCVADGGLLSFMENMDLYSLFGNALDNAIEAVEKLPEEGMRQIDVLIYKQQSFLVINILNPVGEKLIFEEGLPVTTKADKNFHGFGVRSMKYVVKKYDGFLNASEEDGCFSLKMLIPIPS